MSEKKQNLKNLKYLGFPLGLLFPLIALIADVLIKDLAYNLSSVIQLHKMNPLHWIIDSAPIVLGFGFYFFVRFIERRENLLLDKSEIRLKNEKKLLRFIDDINKGDFTTTIEKNEEAEDDEFVDSLLKLRQKLEEEKENEKIRNWTNEGLAKFSEVLRSGQEMQVMYDRLISNIVENIEANQGGLYVIDEDEEDEGEKSINLVSCYAYSRKKFEERKLKIGQGLLGQTYLEKQTMVLKQIPKDYVSITSGMGEATPNNLLIIPLMVNESVEALLEVASFKEFEPHHVEFLEKLGEGIASTVSTIKVDQKTKTLLTQSQIQTEEIRAQEEEMRQNMEELQATQEEMSRKEQEYVERIEILEKEAELKKS